MICTVSTHCFVLKHNDVLIAIHASLYLSTQKHLPANDIHLTTEDNVRRLLEIMRSIHVIWTDKQRNNRKIIRALNTLVVFKLHVSYFCFTCKCFLAYLPLGFSLRELSLENEMVIYILFHWTKSIPYFCINRCIDILWWLISWFILLHCRLISA